MLLNIEPGLIIWTIITFIVLLIVLRKVAWGPILTALEQHQQMLTDANREVGRLLEQGREEAERLRISLTEQARAEAQRLTEAAQREIVREKQLAMQELKNTAADLALAAAGHLLNTAMTGEDHRRLVSEFLDHFPERMEG